MRKLFTAFQHAHRLCAIATIICIHAVNVSAQDSNFDDLPLNGVAAFEQLRKEYYIGGLYLESLSQDSGSAFNFSGRKRMEIRITIDKWSPRRFAQQWNQLLLINNDQESLNEFSDQILAFIDMPKDDLVAGDRITIDLDPDKGTTVYLNGNEVLNESNNAFFDLLLNTWIGQRPPSTDFKNNILTLSTDQAGTQLLTRFEIHTTEEARQKTVAKWFDKPTKSKSSDSKLAPPASSVAMAPPGQGGTRVKAKRTQVKATPEPKAKPKKKKALAVAQPKIVAPKVEKPKLAALPTAAKKPAPTPKPAAKPKPEPKKVAKKEAAPKENPQTKLMRTYRSNILKLTYLNTQYPKRAMDFKQEGLVVLKVTINREGKLLDIDEDTKSKHKLLNNAARKAVKKTAPYPEVPKDLAGDTIEVTLPFNFKL